MFITSIRFISQYFTLLLYTFMIYFVLKLTPGQVSIISTVSYETCFYLVIQCS